MSSTKLEKKNTPKAGSLISTQEVCLHKESFQLSHSPLTPIKAPCISFPPNTPHQTMKNSLSNFNTSMMPTTFYNIIGDITTKSCATKRTLTET